MKRSGLFVIWLIILSTMLGVMLPLSVSAQEPVTDFATTDVMEDLTSSTVNGEAFDVLDYPFKESGDPIIFNMVEYCYSINKNLKKDYGLYVYIYNPTGVAIDATSKQNKIQMAVEYDDGGAATRYEKFALSLCSVSSGNYENLFYKFKIQDREINGTKFIDRVNSHSRQYDISGFELLTKGENNATEYGTGLKYVFSGYAKGYGGGAEDASTLTCVSQDIETLSLQVHHTYYRTGLSDKGDGHYNEVNTVYFSVPESIFEKYGNLQKIHAEWWEYKTKMAMVTSSLDFYNAFLPNVGVDTGGYSQDVPLYLYYGQETINGAGYTVLTYDWAYNLYPSSSFAYETMIDDVYTMIPYAFYSSASSSENAIFDFLHSDPVAGDVGGTVLQEWIYTYVSKSGGQNIDCNGRPISSELFENSVDEGRIMGYNNVNIDLGDTFDLNSYDSSHTWWDKLWDFGFSWPSTSEEYKNVAPIAILSAEDLTGSNAEVSKRLLVSQDDVVTLKAYYVTETAKGNRVVLFRFASTDYFTKAVGRSGVNGTTGTGEGRADTYIAQQTVFLDFDIIDLTFNKDGDYHVIPVVSSPMDIVNDITAPPEELEWWKVVIAILALILAVIIIVPLLKYIVQLVVWIVKIIWAFIKLVATGIGSLFKRRN